MTKCVDCGAPASAWGDSVVLKGTDTVIMQRYRCVNRHWWDQELVWGG